MTTDALSAGAALPNGDVRRGGHAAALILLAVTVANAFNILGSFAPVQEAAKADLLLSDFQLGLVQGVGASIPIALLAIPIGRLVDRGNRVMLMFVLSLLWSLGAMATAFVVDFNTLFLARMVAGLGGLCSLPVAISLAADMGPPQGRGRALFVLSLGKIVGAAAAFVLGGLAFAYFAANTAAPLLGLAPWRAVQLVFGAGGLVMSFTLPLIREPARQEIVEHVASAGAALKEIWSRRSFIAPLFVGQIGVVMADVAALVWAAPVLQRQFHQQPGDFAGWMGGAVLLSGVLGSLIGAFAADFGQKARYKGGIIVGAVVLSLVSIPTALFPVMPDIAGFAVMFGVLLLAGSVCGLITSAALAVLVPNEIRGVCLSAFIILASIVGFGAAPLLVTVLSQALGGESKLGLALAITGVVFNLLSAAGFVVAMLKAPAKVAEA
jgi:MFS family permease